MEMAVVDGTRNIYGKLGVHNRKEAVVRARALGILPP
jgi:ATP/maltotriose-dependent transcriptional regulator MalT